MTIARRCNRLVLSALFAAASLLTAAIAQANPDPPTSPQPVALPSLDRVAMYEEQSKNPLGALAWELIAGAGSIYAGDARGAAVTWGLLVAGFAAMVWGGYNLGIADHDGDPNNNPSPTHQSLAGPAILSGMALSFGGRIYGFANAVGATHRYNAVLRVRLGLPADPDVPR